MVLQMAKDANASRIAISKVLAEVRETEDILSAARDALQGRENALEAAKAENEAVLTTYEEVEAEAETLARKDAETQGELDAVRADVEPLARKAEELACSVGWKTTGRVPESCGRPPNSHRFLGGPTRHHHRGLRQAPRILPQNHQDPRMDLLRGQDQRHHRQRPTLRNRGLPPSRHARGHTLGHGILRSPKRPCRLGQTLPPNPSHLGSGKLLLRRGNAGFGEPERFLKKGETIELERSAKPSASRKRRTNPSKKPRPPSKETKTPTIPRPPSPSPMIYPRPRPPDLPLQHPPLPRGIPRSRRSISPRRSVSPRGRFTPASRFFASARCLPARWCRISPASLKRPFRRLRHTPAPLRPPATLHLLLTTSRARLCNFLSMDPLPDSTGLPPDTEQIFEVQPDTKADELAGLSRPRSR